MPALAFLRASGGLPTCVNNNRCSFQRLAFQFTASNGSRVHTDLTVRSSFLLFHFQLADPQFSLIQRSNALTLQASEAAKLAGVAVGLCDSTVFSEVTAGPLSPYFS